MHFNLGLTSFIDCFGDFYYSFLISISSDCFANDNYKPYNIPGAAKSNIKSYGKQ